MESRNFMWFLNKRFIYAYLVIILIFFLVATNSFYTQYVNQKQSLAQRLEDEAAVNLQAQVDEMALKVKTQREYYISQYTPVIEKKIDGYKKLIDNAAVMNINGLMDLDEYGIAILGKDKSILYSNNYDITSFNTNDLKVGSINNQITGENDFAYEAAYLSDSRILLIYMNLKDVMSEYLEESGFLIRNENGEVIHSTAPEFSEGMKIFKSQSLYGYTIEAFFTKSDLLKRSDFLLSGIKVDIGAAIFALIFAIIATSIIMILQFLYYSKEAFEMGQSIDRQIDEAVETGKYIDVGAIKYDEYRMFAKSANKLVAKIDSLTEINQSEDINKIQGIKTIPIELSEKSSKVDLDSILFDLRTLENVKMDVVNDLSSMDEGMVLQLDNLRKIIHTRIKEMPDECRHKITADLFEDSDFKVMYLLYKGTCKMFDSVEGDFENFSEKFAGSYKEFTYGRESEDEFSIKLIN